jgi:hypothetical protein
LEWGYLANWPSGQYGRAQLVRYARAAGLDDEVVIRAVVPEFAAVGRPLGALAPVPTATPPAAPPPAAAAAAPAALVAKDEQVRTSLVPFEPAVPTFAMPARRRGRAPWIAALAIPALLAIGLVPALWISYSGQAQEVQSASEAVNRTATPPPPVEAQNAVRPPAVAPAPPVEASNPPQQETSPTRDPIVSEAPTPHPAPLRANRSFSPAFATVGSAMFYHTGSDSPSAIMRADTDASGAVLRITRVVDDKSQNYHARPSPDGSQIAFDSDRDAVQDGDRAVYVANADGRNVRRVTGPGFAAVPSWSPDGHTLAYVRAEDKGPNDTGPEVWNLWTLNLENGESRRLTSHAIGQPWGAAWFPDGEWIAYSHETRLIVRSVKDGSQRIYPSPRKGRLLRTPAVSPDGQRIMFQVYRDGAWLLDLSDGSMRRILSDPTAEEFTWSPDGQQVAYHSRQTGKWGVWIMAPR